MKFKTYHLLALVFIYTSILMLFVSTDSYLYFPYGKTDSAAFFMAGKAWMNGMVPYVDFADGKGPLLWLMYGVGYLLSPNSYHGVFWISIFFVSVTLIYIYKVSNLYISDFKSLLVSIFTSYAMFNPLFHDETRVETFCWAFISVSVYVVLWAVKLSNQSVSNKTFYVNSLLLGISFAASLLMKFTIAAMLVICIVYYIYSLWKRKQSLIMPLFGLMSGVCLIILPFIIYFVNIGHLNDAIREYFIVIIGTDDVAVGNPIVNIIINYGLCLFRLITNYNYMFNVVFAISLIFTYLFCKVFHKTEKNILLKYSPFIIHLWILGISIYHSLWIYYYETCSVMTCFLLILIVDRFELGVINNKKAFKTILFGLFIGILLVHPFQNKSLKINPRNLDNNNRYEQINQIISKVDKPKLLYFHILDFGYGINAGALPACKYWFFQNGGTEVMLNNQIDAIKKRMADFVITYPSNRLLPILKENGYEKVNIDFGLLLYRKNEHDFK